MSGTEENADRACTFHLGLSVTLRVGSDHLVKQCNRQRKPRNTTLHELPIVSVLDRSVRGEIPVVRTSIGKLRHRKASQPALSLVLSW